MANNRYSYETKLEAVRLLNTGMSGREIVQKLGLKSDGLIHTWRKYVRNGDYYRLRQEPGKQYKYRKGSASNSSEIQYQQDIEAMKQELTVVKKYLIKERLW
ncbi:transposase [Companilactobacillus mishanensis]|uniref:Transposase n=1 Tax=Companilactobacillus mishanensis TaxID=2486008 RepID=A0ABW9P7W3_9LACO|nr:transposase [Companilactobacillus mishanensis]MQS45299.1 transposase [Companilactobacillus mishanensis]